MDRGMRDVLNSTHSRTWFSPQRVSSTEELGRTRSISHHLTYGTLSISSGTGGQQLYDTSTPSFTWATPQDFRSGGGIGEAEANGARLAAP
ncbi:hypothetical protein H5410_042697 [Solanum commersonii]|uniref:Uncharacterized protein n=1 Tax=Solanum commersonii TaxID=4109 RepID=A0A9J5XX39_SOLCO|nr:hypothetical protein H5410_042697 [Solanum commersonii]